MPHVIHQGYRLHYEIHGTGWPVVLLHGGTVSFERNYAACGWIGQLHEAELQAIGLDFRGHGSSDKPHDPRDYGTEVLAGDVVAVLDHLGLDRVSLIGYSIGTVIALSLLRDAPERFESAALIATGDGLIGQRPRTLAVVLPALVPVLERTESPEDLPESLATYWRFVQEASSDRAALSAFARASYPPLTVEELSSIDTPTLVVSGEKDSVLGRGPRLADALACGEYLEIGGADHFSLATDAGTKAAVARYLTSTADGAPTE